MIGDAYITLRYSNNCSIGDTMLPGEYYDMILNGVIGEPTYEHIEQVNENEEKEVDFVQRTCKKSITLLLIADEWVLDVLNFVRICDNKVLINKAGDVYNINEMEVDGTVEQGHNLIKVKFVLFIVTNNKCCTSLITNTDLVNPKYTVWSEIFDDNPIYENPESIPLNAYVVVISEGSQTVLLQRVNEENKPLPYGWKYAELNEFDYYKGIDGVYWQTLQSEQNKIVRLPYIREIDISGVNEVNEAIAYGQALQGYVIGLQFEDGVFGNSNFNDLSTNNQSALEYNGSGTPVFTGKSGNVFRLYLATLDAPDVPLCYSNEIEIP